MLVAFDMWHSFMTDFSVRDRHFSQHTILSCRDYSSVGELSAQDCQLEAKSGNWPAQMQQSWAQSPSLKSDLNIMIITCFNWCEYEQQLIPLETTETFEGGENSYSFRRGRAKYWPERRVFNFRVLSWNYLDLRFLRIIILSPELKHVFFLVCVKLLGRN